MILPTLSETMGGDVHAHLADELGERRGLSLPTNAPVHRIANCLRRTGNTAQPHTSEEKIDEAHT